MFHYFSTLTNQRGDSLPEWQVEAVQLSDGSTVVPIYADESSTAISSVSGVTNRAVSDPEGNFDFFIPSGTYSLRIYDRNGVFQKIQRYLPLYGADAFSGSGGAASVGFLPSGTGAAARTAQDKMRDRASVEDYTGADASAQLAAALTAKTNINIAAGKAYTVGGVTLTNSQSIDANNAAITAKTSSTNVFKLTNYAPRLSSAYFASGANASDAIVKLEESRYASLTDISAVNAGHGFINLTPNNPATGFIALATIANCDAEDISGTGVTIGSSVSELRVTNMHLQGLLVNTAGLYKPTASSIGWRQNTPLSTYATGGHQVVNANMIGFEKGFHFTDALLSKFSNSTADSCSDYGLLVDGVSDYMDFADLFVGTSRGIKIAGSARVNIDGLRTALNGVIPPWGTSDFFNGISTFYDLEVRGTSKLIVRNWTGDHRISVDSTAKLIVDDGETLEGRSNAALAANKTWFVGPTGAVDASSGNESDAVWRAPWDGYLIRLDSTVETAPGGSQSFVYTARINGADVALAQTISAADFNTAEAWAGSHIPFNRGDSISCKLVTSATAAASRHWPLLQIVPRN